MEYIIKKELFTKVKFNLDGYIMWREVDNQVVVKLVCPNLQISNFLKLNHE